MSLRLRVVLLIGIVLLSSMALGALAAGYQVTRVLGAELGAGLDGARQTVASAFEDLPQSEHPARDLRQLVATFDGNRHVRASLIDHDGHQIAASRTAIEGHAPPQWFRHILGTTPAEVMLQVPATRAGSDVLVLTPTPDLDVQAAWNEFGALMIVPATTAAVALWLVYLLIGVAFRPLTHLTAQFKHIGAGDYSGRVNEIGSPEILGLQRGFNHMAGALAATTERNRLLTEQLAKLQEEERADIARDLHDEIGPHLFAVNLDAEMITQLCEAERHAAVPERAREIQSAVHYMQRQVRDLLGRLRPTQVTEFGLAVAIEDMVRFWSTRQPDIAFSLSLAKDEIPEATAEVIYRIVQEAVNNAVRHGKPRTIRICVETRGHSDMFVAVYDDGSVATSPGARRQASSGLGLIGMRERVEAVGGTLTYGPRVTGAGWNVAAHLPVMRARLTQTQRSTVDIKA